MKYEFILIDADDTLLDFKKCEKAALFQTLSEFGVECKDEIYDSFSANNDMLWKKLEKKQVEKSDLIVLRFSLTFEEYGIELDAVSVNLKYMDNLSTKAFLIDGAKDICSYISKTRRLFMITNASKSVQLKRLSISGIEHFFERIFISEDVGFVKPSYEYFDAVCRSIDGFDKQKALVVGDSLTSDIKGANNYGIDCVFFDRKGKEIPQDLKIDYRISSLEELKVIIG